MTTTNRRSAPRLVTCIAVGVQSQDRDLVGLVRDATGEGALLFTQVQFKIDDKVKLSIRVDLEGTGTVEVNGRIVRVERKPDGFWTFQLGVLFEPRRDDLTSVFKALAARQERLYGSPA